jgi:hypothetical protein
MTFDEAVDYILEFTGYKENTGIVPQSHRIDRSYKPREEKVFRLPPKNDNSNELYRYLQEERGLSKRVINFFIERGLLYESADHDVVFKGYDKNGICKFASRRGTKTIPGEAPRKKDVYGNDKQYGVNIVNDYSREVCVFEAAIDLMSYMDIYDSYKSNKVVLGGTHDAPLETFLVEHPQIDSIRFCMDNDNAGMTAMQEYEEKYQAQGYETMICPVKEEGCKDYNELLQKLRKEEKAKKLAEKRQKAII